MTEKEFALKDLRAIKQVLDELGINFSLAYGTCLGAYRDKDFLPDDDDIDLAITEKLPLETRQTIAEKLMDIGFKAQKMYWVVDGRKVDGVADYVGNEKTGIIVVERYFKVTLFFFYDDGKEMICIPHDMPLISSLSKFYKKLKKIKFKGDWYLVPTPTDEYLKWTYGDWKDKTLRNHGKLYYEINH
jgi:phosphorylcholine metabolism protein LicD